MLPFSAGFHVPAHNIFAFASTSFLTVGSTIVLILSQIDLESSQSFFPILLVAPLGFLWITTDYTVKRFQVRISPALAKRCAI